MGAAVRHASIPSLSGHWRYIVYIGGLKVSENGEVLRSDSTPITGLYACGEIVGGVFFGGYPGGAGLTAGAVFGRAAGYGAVKRT